MARYGMRFECGHPGCPEIAHYECRTRKEQADLYRSYGDGKYRCVRHAQPDELLSASNLTRSVEIVSRQEDHGRYWGHSGFIYGPGFKAFAQDFPAGTTIKVTAEIVLPPEQR